MSRFTGRFYVAFVCEDTEYRPWPLSVLARHKHAAITPTRCHANRDRFKTFRTSSRVHFHLGTACHPGVNVATHPPDPYPGSFGVVVAHASGAVLCPHLKTSSTPS